MRAVQVARRVTSYFGAFALHATLGTLALAPSAQAKATYTILPAGYGALSINDSGTVAGVEGSAGFIRTPDGSITTFHALGDFLTSALSINANDEITGSYKDASNVSHGYMRTGDGTITVFDAPGAGTGGGQGTFAVGINKAGTVTGTYLVDSSETDHSFIRTADGNITEIKVTGSDDTQVRGINDKGAIAGQYDHADGEHGFVRTAGGNVKKFDVPGNNLATFVQCINSKGAIAGYYVDSSRVVHDYIRAADGTFTLFDTPGLDPIPTGINSKGLVIGVNSENKQRRSLGFLREPNGAIRKIRAPGVKGGIDPTSINASGLIAGYFLVRVNKNEYEPYGFIRTP